MGLKVSKVCNSDGLLLCPHCGRKIYSWENGLIENYPHIVFASVWNNPNFFVVVRPDYANAFLGALKGSMKYKEYLAEDDWQPIEPEIEKVFLTGKIVENDEVAKIIAGYCWDFPEIMFPSILGESTIIFTDDHAHSGIHIGVDSGLHDT